MLSFVTALCPGSLSLELADARSVTHEGTASALTLLKSSEVERQKCRKAADTDFGRKESNKGGRRRSRRRESSKKRKIKEEGKMSGVEVIE